MKQNVTGQARTVSVVEAAAMLGIAPNSYYRAARSGEVPSLRVGGRVLVPREPLMRLLGSIDEPGAPRADHPAPVETVKVRDGSLDWPGSAAARTGVA